MKNDHTKTIYLELKNIHKGSAKFQPNPILFLQQMATESAETKKSASPWAIQSEDGMPQ